MSWYIWNFDKRQSSKRLVSSKVLDGHSDGVEVEGGGGEAEEKKCIRCLGPVLGSDDAKNFAL